MKTGLPKRGLAIDWETTGYSKPTEVDGHFVGYAKNYQGIALGAVVFDLETFNPVDTYYVEIKYDPSKTWSDGAEKIHGLSKAHLEEHGLAEQDAAVEFMNWLLKYFMPDEEILIMGHNKDFDISFLHAFLDKFGVMPKVWYRGINTVDLGIVAFGICKSDQLFDKLGLPPRQDHNALEDALYTLEVARTIKALVNYALDGE
jgi:DNA polymerase III epsilon subunit-like protein